MAWRRLSLLGLVLLVAGRGAEANRKADVVVVGVGPAGASYLKLLRKQAPHLRLVGIDKRAENTVSVTAKPTIDQRLVLQDLPLLHFEKNFGTLPNDLTRLDFVALLQGNRVRTHRFPPHPRKNLPLDAENVIAAYRYPQKLATFGALSSWLLEEMGKTEGITFLPGHTAHTVTEQGGGATVVASSNQGGDPVTVEGRLLVIADGRSPLVDQLPHVETVPNPYPESLITGVLPQSAGHAGYLRKLVIAEGKIGSDGTGAVLIGTQPDPALVVMTQPGKRLGKNAQRRLMEDASTLFGTAPPKEIFPFSTPTTRIENPWIGDATLFIGSIPVPLRTGSNVGFDLVQAKTLADHTLAILNGDSQAGENYGAASAANFEKVKTWAASLAEKMNVPGELSAAEIQPQLRRFGYLPEREETR